MQLQFLLLSALAFTIGLQPMQAGEVYTENAMDKFHRDDTTAGKLLPAHLRMARNDHELFQLRFRADADPITNAAVESVTVTDAAGRPMPFLFTWRKAHYIHCKEYVQTPAWWPDALLPYQHETFQVDANCNQSLYCDVYVPPETPPGTYSGTLRLQLDGRQLTTPLTLDVHTATVPVQPGFDTAFALWPDQITAPYEGMQPGSPEAKRLYETIYWFLADYRMAPDDLPVALDSPEAQRYFDDPRIRSFRIPYDPGKIDEFKALCDTLRTQGQLQRGYVYTLDEPSRTQYAMCIDYSKKLHDAVPDARFLLTVNGGASANLADVVDIWSPILSGYNDDREFFIGRQKQGEKVWWYTCVWPPRPYPTYLIDDSGIAPRILGAMQAQYGVTGNLYWAVNIWKKYSLADSQYHPRDVWNDPAAFPNANGDGYLIYPAPTPEELPIPSLRLEMIRQGHEDIELCALLRELTDTAARELGLPSEENWGAQRVYSLVHAVAPMMTRYSTAAAEYDQMRLRLLEEIDALQQGPRALLNLPRPEGEVHADAISDGLHGTIHLSDEATEWNLSSTPSGLLTFNRSGASTRFTWYPALGENRLELRVKDASGHEAQYTRVYRVINEGVKQVAVTRWDDPTFVDTLECENVDILPVAGSVVKKFRYRKEVEFPCVRLPSPKSFDKSGFLTLAVQNPGATSLVMTAKYHFADGRKFDGMSFTLQPNETKEITFEYMPCEKIELWMSEAPEDREIILNRMTLSNDRGSANHL